MKFNCLSDAGEWTVETKKKYPYLATFNDGTASGNAVLLFVAKHSAVVLLDEKHPENIGKFSSLFENQKTAFKLRDMRLTLEEDRQK